MGLVCERCPSTLDTVIYCPKCDGDLLEQLRELREVLKATLTIDWNLESGDFYNPATYAGKVWANIRALLEKHDG